MRSFLIGVGLLFLVTQCSIKAPEVRVTGEKTALEREVLGTYHQLEEDTWMVASMRSSRREGEVRLSPEKERVLEAMQTQKFNKDDVDEFKRKGLVGESKDGMLVIRSSKILEENPEMDRLVREIVQEENENRTLIMNRVVELNDRLRESRQEEILNIFARMNQENSPRGTWIERDDGTWIKK
ncbi:MAG TPA: DUF1318 domain-containing protein [bacterium]|nr:DUF1318 domain-containing protein [bacterium]